MRRYRRSTVIAPPLPRDQFPVADRYCYLDHAGIAAPPLVVAHAVARDASAGTMLGSVGTHRRDERAEQVRTSCAALLGVPAAEVTFLKSSAEGLRLLAFGLRWAPGDRVLLADCEHPATAHPWEALAALGVDVEAVPAEGPAWALPLDGFERALRAGGGRVKVVVVSWVHYARGWRTDLAALAALAHEHGAILVADVVQGLGVIPCHLAEWGVDAAVADGHCWLLGPEGIGVLHLSPELRRTLWSATIDDGDTATAGGPPDVGVDPPRSGDDQPGPSTDHRFEVGSPNRHGIAGLGAAADLLGGVGVPAIWSYVDAWCDEFAAGLVALGAEVLSDRSAEGRSAIVTARFGDADPGELTERLVTHGVIVSGRSDAVRFAPHGWNDESDLHAALRAVRRAWRR